MILSTIMEVHADYTQTTALKLNIHEVANWFWTETDENSTILL